MIRAAFFDIDGTLLGLQNHEMTPATREALYELREKGIRLFLSTGRSPSTVEAVWDRLRFDFDGMICVNGQYCTAKGQVVRDAPLPGETVEKVVRLLTRENVACTVFELDRFSVNIMNDVMRQVKAELDRSGREYPTADADSLAGKSVYQISPYCPPETETLLLHKLPTLRSVRWHEKFADWIPATGGKGVGVRCVCEHFGFAPEDAISFGDGGNDAEMLLASGIGVAMGGGSEEACRAADYITDSSEEDGIPHALRHFGIL